MRLRRRLDEKPTSERDPWARQKRIAFACSRLEPLQEGRPCRLARFSRFKEELEHSVRGWGQRRRVKNRRIEILGALAFARTRPRQDEATHQLGAVQRQVLSDIATQREAEQIDLPQLEGVEEVKSVLRHSSHVVGDFPTGEANARIIESDHRAILRKPIEEGRIPVVHRATEVLQKDQRGCRWVSETPIGKAHLPGTHKACWSCLGALWLFALILLCHHLVLSLIC